MIKIIHYGKTDKQFHRFVCPVCECDYVCDNEELVERKIDTHYYETTGHCPWCGASIPVKEERQFIQIPQNEDPEEYLLQFFNAE